jgi:twitching motility two-component system response regulator PilH
MQRSGTDGGKGGPKAAAVLVIDDSDVDREVMAELLLAAGYQVHTLPSPIGATRLARELRVNAVVIDQNLPAMNGSKLAALFRGTPALRDVRLVLVSGNDEAAMLEVARDAQADAFVSKGKMHRELIPVVKRLLR